MTSRRHRVRIAVLLAGLLVGGGSVAAPVLAQSDPVGDLFTTTTTPSQSPTTTAAPAPAAEPDTAPPGAPDAGGDGASAPAGGIEVPPEAQKIIDSVKRTPGSSTERLFAGLSALTALGLSQEEAVRVGMGRVPVAGVARWTHDWLYPRYGPGFRFHLGCDVMAPFGTPVRAPVDGVVSASTDSLGGLTARVTMPDRTQFAFAHLSALAEPFVDGASVAVGDIIGYVGDSGNAKGTPHVHVAVYPKGGRATDPKPVLDGFLRDAEAALPGIVAQYAAARPQGTRILVPLLAVDPDARLLRPALGARAMHHWVSGNDEWTPTDLYVLASDPALGAGYLLQSSIDDLANTINWRSRATAGR